MEKRTCRSRMKQLRFGKAGRSWLCLMMVMLLFPSFPLTARADMGPKPSVNLTFEGLEDEEYYVTLITNEEVNGPWSVDCEYQEHYGDREAWDKFKKFSDEDGFVFQGYFEKSSETDSFAWTYYPPDTFKILMYFPDKNQMVVSSEIYKSYAFDSYFTVDASDIKIRSVTAEISAEGETETLITEGEMALAESYDYKGEIISFFCRVVATLLIELAIAWVFRYCKKYQMKVIVLTNVVTQILLNILLSVILYKAGDLAFFFGYILFELIVFVIEGVTFAALLNKPERTGKFRAWMYAFVANAASFWIGMQIAKWIPGIF